jgi:hypothetical protein
MQKLNMIEAYRELPEGENAVFFHPEGQETQSRLIKMRINAPQPVNLWLTPVDRIDPETGEVDEASIFLGHADAGLEQIEFYYRGSFALSALGGAIWLDTVDNTYFSVEASDDTSYARLWEREERDPRILEIEQAARHNQRILMEQMAADRAAFAAQMQALTESVKTNVSTSSAPASGGTASAEPVVSTVAPTGDQTATAPVATGAAGEPNVAS